MFFSSYPFLCSGMMCYNWSLIRELLLFLKYKWPAYKSQRSYCFCWFILAEKKYISTLYLSGVLGLSPSSFSLVPLFQAFISVVVSQSLLLAKQDCRKTLTVFSNFLIGSLYKLEFWCQHQFMPVFFFLIEIQHLSKLCLCIVSFSGCLSRTYLFTSSLSVYRSW